MTRSLAMNARNDLVCGADGNLAFVSKRDAVTQNCKSLMQAQLGEMVLALSRGVPTFDTVWDEWRPEQFEAATRAMLRSVVGVIGVTTLKVARAESVMHYDATIQTVYGEVILGG